VPDQSKALVRPYESLMKFANKEAITEGNWETVLRDLRSFPSTRRRTEPSPVMHLEDREITGPKPLQDIQRELRNEFAWLTYSKEKKNLFGLFQKINHMKIKAEILLETSKSDYSNLSLTDPVIPRSFINDLRALVYCQLAEMWSDGLFSRIGRCRNRRCRQFFLAKTSRTDRQYCSQSCGQKVTAAQRAKDSRVRRATWEEVRTQLERALENMHTLHKTTERQALEQAEKRLTKAQQGFATAYPRNKGPGYKEGQTFLVQATDKIKRLRKKVKGY
jgi:hypothetical protein